MMMKALGERLAELGLHSMEKSISRPSTPMPRSTFVTYQPGNMTRYECAVFVDAFDDGYGLFVVHSLGRSMKLESGWVHPGYVAEKMSIGMGDAVPLALLWEHLTATDDGDV